MNEAHDAHGSSASLNRAADPTPAAVPTSFASPLVGPFPLLPNSQDAPAVVPLPPGASALECNPAGGDVRLEVDFLP